MSLSSHKIYGPKGIGALYVRRRPRVRLEPLMSGGGQERGLRSGTVPTPLTVGFGAACRIAQQEMHRDRAHVDQLQARLLQGIRARLQGVQLNGAEPGPQRYPGNVNLSFAYVEGESLLMGLKSIAVSSGSACTSASLEPSYVLRALGVEEDMAHTSIRYGLGRFTTAAEVDRAVELTVEHVNKLREMSPLWEMVQEGVDIKSIQWAQVSFFVRMTLCGSRELCVWFCPSRSFFFSFLTCFVFLQSFAMTALKGGGGRAGAGGSARHKWQPAGSLSEVPQNVRSLQYRSLLDASAAVTAV